MDALRASLGSGAKVAAKKSERKPARRIGEPAKTAALAKAAKSAAAKPAGAAKSRRVGAEVFRR